MPILRIKHVTTYQYHQPVAFGEHRMMLRPRDDDDQAVLDLALEITPKPVQLVWSRDSFNNHVATAAFADRAAELRFASTMSVDHAPSGFRAIDIADFARTIPFRYPAPDWPALKRFVPSTSACSELERWTASFFRGDGSADTHALLTAMTQTIRRTFKHVARHENGVQKPRQTLACGSGCCRDLAVLMIAALRSRGIAARFVSGYVRLADEDDDGELAGGNTHAWLQAYIPGPGWVDFDPSSGTIGNRNLVRVAVVAHPRGAIPLQGSWFGSATDHLAMNVAVKVSAANDIRA